MRISFVSSRSRLVAAVMAVGMLIGLGAAAGPLPASIDAPFTPIETLYAEDFESGDGGYTTGGTTTFEYGTPLAPPVPAVGQAPTMWGTNLDGTYNNSECGYVQSPAIDLSGFPSAPAGSLARLVYRQWLHTENRYDAGIVAVSTDGVNFTRIEPIGGYNDVPLTTARACLGLGTTDKAFTTATAPADDGWTTPSFDVTPYLGGPLHVRWMFASDSSVVKNGWYVDDVAVQIGVGGSVPVPDAAAPDVSVAFQPLVPFYVEDFEAGDGGWSPAGTDTWELGSPVSPPEPRAGSLAMWGTHLLGDYVPNECASLTSPAIEIPGAGDVPAVQLVRLSMNLWRYTERSYDGAVLQVSADDGESWSLVTPDAGGYDASIIASTTRTCLGVASGQAVWTGPTTAPKADEYLSVGADLTQFMGSTIRLRLVFASDGDTERRGVYMDDVAIQGGVGLSAAGVGDPTAPCGTFPGWTVAGTNSSWCYGSPTTGPASTKPVFATNLGGNYNSSECSTLTSPAIDTRSVNGLSTLTLQFEHFMQTYNTSDGGVVQVSDNDGASWTTVTPVGAYNSTLGTDARACVEPAATTRSGWSGAATPNEYQLRQIRLGSYDGDTIRIRFIFGSSSSLERLGWYLRAVSLTKGAGIVPLLP